MRFSTLHPCPEEERLNKTKKRETFHGNIFPFTKKFSFEILLAENIFSLDTKAYT
jgi:hypothetical protein